MEPPEMLEYENQMFLEVLHEDGLVVVAKGLGIDTVFTNILKVYLDPGNLVLVLGTTDGDEDYFIDKLKSQGLKYLPKVVTAQTLSSERELMYLEGGVLFISGRILVVDLLKNRVPLQLVTGILVYRAHNILNSYQEAFALRLYRQTNKTGFIKAFTNSALAFTVGYAQVERVMKTIFVKQLYLWPRFHKTVINSLSRHQPEVIELHVKLTSKMLKIQTALLDVMNFIVKELKRINKYLDLDELTIENAIAKKFHKQLQMQLDPIWHQLSQATKQLIADLKTLRSLLICLTFEDSVSFYARLNSFRSIEYAMKSSGWLMLDAVENLFKFAKSRVYNEKNELQPEASPKWTALREIISEIRRDKKEEDCPENLKKVLILVQDGNTCKQVKNYLTMGANQYLLYEAMKKLEPDGIKGPSSKGSSTESEVEKSCTDEELNENQDSYVLTLTQKSSSSQSKGIEDDEGEDGEMEEKEAEVENYFEECSQMADLDLTTITTTEPLIIVQSLKKGGDSMALQRILTELMPSYVVMYVADISTVRQLEVYQSYNPSIHVKVYFLIHGGSVEEQGYLTSLRREKEAFEKLINAKATMVIPSDQDGKSEDCAALSREKETEEISSRKAGGSAEKQNQVDKVIVDMREFRSELPTLLHKRGMDIDPVTLVVGDYILSPEICIERKSISDLIGSLNSGRLYNQAVSMTRHYAKPMLLIEFDQNKPFSLQGNYYISKDMKSIDITAKLQLLTLHFPKLKLVWSQSPHATAQLFEELKQGRDQPDPVKAAQIGLDENTEDLKAMTEKYNTNIQDLISKLPGVHSKNLRVLLNQGKSLDHLISLSEEEINEIVGNSNDAKNLYKALHNKIQPNEDSTAGQSRPAAKGRGYKFSRKKQ